MKSMIAQATIDKLIAEGQIDPVHREEMIAHLDSEIRRQTRSMIGKLAGGAVQVVARRHGFAGMMA